MLRCCFCFCCVHSSASAAACALLLQLFEKGPLLSDHRGHGYIRTFCREVQTLGQLHHPNICAFYGASISLPRCCIVTEHMDRGSLWSQLHGSGDTSIDFMATAAQVPPSLPVFACLASLGFST